MFLGFRGQRPDWTERDAQRKTLRTRRDKSPGGYVRDLPGLFCIGGK